MDTPPNPHEGLNFYVPWEFLEYAIGAMCTAGFAVAGWVWHLGGRIARLEEEKALIAERHGEQQARLERLEKVLGERLYEAEQARSDLKNELMQRLNNLPSREFIESQITQLTQRLDGLIDARLRDQRPSR